MVRFPYQEGKETTPIAGDKGARTLHKLRV